MKDDDLSVEGSDTLYWRAPRLPMENWTIFDEGRNDYRVRAGAFVWNDDGVSCYRHSILDGLGLDYHVIKKESQNGILSVTAGDVRSCELGVAADPNPEYIARDELEPHDEAHALIVVADDVKRRKRSDRCSKLARSANIAHWGEPDPR